MTFLGVKLFHSISIPHGTILDANTFPMMQEIRVNMQTLCLPKADLPCLTTMVQGDAMSTPITHEKEAIHVGNWHKTLQGLNL